VDAASGYVTVAKSAVELDDHERGRIDSFLVTEWNNTERGGRRLE
jgi:hypothetical protein